MLDFMRRNARSWVVSVALGIISLVFVFYMGGGARIGSGPQAVAMVGDTQITMNELQRARTRNEQRYREQAGGKLTREMLRALDLPSMTLNQLIDRTVLVQEAERIGLRVPNDSLRMAIRQVPAFQRNGSFSPGVYKMLVRQQGLSAAGFEHSMREDILVQQLLDVIRRGVHISEDQAFEKYRRENDKISLRYIDVPSSAFRDKVTIDEEALTAFFDENSEQYRRPEQVRIRYAAYAPDAFVAQTTVDDEAIEEYYYLNSDREFTSSERVGARHILKKVAPDADEQTKAAARAALEAIAKRIAAASPSRIACRTRKRAVPPKRARIEAFKSGCRATIKRTAVGSETSKSGSVADGARPRTRSASNKAMIRAASSMASLARADWSSASAL